MAAEEGNVRVAVRCRPINARETALGDSNIFSVSDGAVTVSDPKKDSVRRFAFDFMYDATSEQEAVYKDLGVPMLNKAFEGFNATIFAYGQTGSGKTHCMSGSPGMPGIIPRMNAELFERIHEITGQEGNTKAFLVECSYFEVYNEVIYDLLDPTRRAGAHSTHGLEIKEDKARGIYVKGLTNVVVDNAEKLRELMEQGNSVRVQAATKMNDRSSRSHSIFCIKLQQRDAADEKHNIFAKINLVDLAGSERVSKTGATGSTLREGANINKSLSTLGMVINKLAEKGKNPNKRVFIPYRNSKLTRVLSQSLGGNSVTLMIATLSPAHSNMDETLTTLRYANSAKSIAVNAVKNEEGMEVQRLNKEIEALKKKLQEQGSGDTMTAAEKAAIEAKYQDDLSELEGVVKQTWEDKARLSKQYEEDRVRLEEETQRQRDKLTAQYEEERRRHRKMLQDKGDVALSIREMFAAKEPAGQRALLLKADLSGWLDLIENATKLTAAARQQVTVATVYKSALETDIARLQAHTHARGAGVLPQEDLMTAAATLNQAQTKLSALQTEGATLVTAQKGAIKALDDLVSAVESAPFTLPAPATPKPGADAAAAGAGIGAGAGVGAGATVEGAADATTAVAAVTAAGTADAAGTPDAELREEEEQQAPHPGEDPQSKSEYKQAMDLVLDQVDQLSDTSRESFSKDRKQLFDMENCMDMLQAGLQAEIQVPSPRKRSKASTASEEFLEVLRTNHSKHRKQVEAAIAGFAALSDIPADQGDRDEQVLAAVANAITVLRSCVTDQLDAVKAETARQRMSEGALIKQLTSEVQDLGAQLLAANETISRQDATLKDVRGQLEAVSTEKTALAAQLGSTNKRLADTSAELVERNEQLAASKASANELAATGDALATTVEGLKAQLAAATEEAEANKAAAEAAKRALNDSRAEANQGNAAMNAVQSELEAAESRCAELSAQLKEGQEQLQASSQREAGLSHKNSELETAIAEGRSAQQALDEKLAAATAELGEWQQRAAALEAAAESSKSALEANEAAAAAATARMAEMTAQAKSQREELAASEAAVERLTKELAEQAAAVAALDAELLDLKSETLRREADQQRAAPQLEDAMHKLAIATEELANANEKAEQLAAELEESKYGEQELTDNLAIVTEERDTAREKEEEYFLLNQENEGELERIQTGYVELSDRFNDKLDEMMDLQMEVEQAKATALRWQQMALRNGTPESAAAAAGSASDAIHKKRKENLLRATVSRIYQSLWTSFTASREDAVTLQGVQVGVSASPPATAAAKSKSKSAVPATPGGGEDGDDDYDDDDYEDDYDDDFEPLESPTPAHRTVPALAPAPAAGTAGAGAGAGAGTGDAGSSLSDSVARSLWTPRNALQPSEIEDMELEELCSKLEKSIQEMEAERKQMLDQLRQQLVQLVEEVKTLRASQ